MFNVEKYLYRCIESLEKQTFKQFEIIFIDDFSNDKSVEIIEDYVLNNRHVRLIKNTQNQGTFHTRRIGVENSNGDYIAFLDPDDELASDALEKINNTIQVSPDLIFFDMFIKPSLKWWQSKPNIPKISIGDSKKTVVSKILNCKNLNYGTSGKAYRKDFLIDVYLELKIPEDKRLVFGEDKLLFFCAVSNVYTAISIEEKLYVYHKNPESVTVLKDDELTLFKINQLVSCIYFIKKTYSKKSSNEEIRLFFEDDLKKDIIRNEINIHKNFFHVLKKYFLLVSLHRNYKDFLKIFIFIFSFGRYKF